MSTKPEAEDEFEAAFRQFAGAAATSSTEVEEDASASQDAQQAADGQPAAAGDADTKPAEAEAPKSGDEGVDRVKQLEERIRQAEHRERSASARIPAFQRKIDELNRRIEELSAAAKPAAAGSDKGASPAANEDQALAVLDETPELRDAVNRLVQREITKAVGEVTKRVDGVTKDIEPLRERSQQEALQAELQVVSKEFPNWERIVYTPEWEDWVKTLPPALQTAYANAKTGADALAFLRMYPGAKAGSQGNGEGAGDGGSSDTAPSAPSAQRQPAAAKPDPRKRLLEKAVGPASRQPAAPVSGLPAEDDFEGAFSFFASKAKGSQMAA